MTKEEPRRLAPNQETLRELYLKSGNQCAFRECNERIINSDGVLIGEICHIEAALNGGERFNNNQTNEDRRSFENLILLCRNHHAITNNTDEFTTEVMKEMKSAHEAKFSSIEEKLLRSIEDKTKLVEPIRYHKLKRLDVVLEWNLDPEELTETANGIDEFVQVLKKVPENTRRIYTIMIERHSFRLQEMVINPEEIEEVTQLKTHEIMKHLAILFKYGLVSKWYKNIDNEPEVKVKDLTDWHFVKDLLSFCVKEKIELSRILVDLDFSVLG